MTTSRIKLMAQVIFLHTKLCKTYRVYCLNYILNESQVNMKDINFVTSLLRCDQLFLEWAQIIKYFYTHCKLLKIMIRDMLFPTKLTSLINTQGLIDSASLKKNHHNNRRNSGSHTWPKTFLGGVYRWCPCDTIKIKSTQYYACKDPVSAVTSSDYLRYQTCH